MGRSSCRSAGIRWSFIEKVPVVSTELLDEQAAYPRPGILACELLDQLAATSDAGVVRITTERPWGVEAVGGASVFDVRRSVLLEL